MTNFLPIVWAIVIKGALRLNGSEPHDEQVSRFGHGIKTAGLHRPGFKPGEEPRFLGFRLRKREVHGICPQINRW